MFVRCYAVTHTHTAHGASHHNTNTPTFTLPPSHTLHPHYLPYNTPRLPFFVLVPVRYSIYHIPLLPVWTTVHTQVTLLTSPSYLLVACTLHLPHSLLTHCYWFTTHAPPLPPQLGIYGGFPHARFYTHTHTPPLNALFRAPRFCAFWTGHLPQFTTACLVLWNIARVVLTPHTGCANTLPPDVYCVGHTPLLPHTGSPPALPGWFVDFLPRSAHTHAARTLPGRTPYPVLTGSQFVTVPCLPHLTPTRVTPSLTPTAFAVPLVLPVAALPNTLARCLYHGIAARCVCLYLHTVFPPARTTVYTATRPLPDSTRRYTRTPGRGRGSPRTDHLRYYG